MTLLIYVIISAFGFGVLGALGFRGAGGLFSQWAKKDLGNFLPRQIWGFTASLPMLPMLIGLSVPWYEKVLFFALTSLLTGMLRGAGWGGSLSLGYPAPMKQPDNTHYARKIIMTFSLFQMLALPVLVTGAIIIANMWLKTDEVKIFIVLEFLCSAIFLPIVVMTFYNMAWKNGGLNLPKLGCYSYDPPPTGELAAGFLTAFDVCLLANAPWSSLS